ncbi:tetratricopeptide repeat protein [Chitinophaga ginsengisoli]|uniref:Tfp pilus assembly protein PilF n=1 Tax=Chitinophaga ginsengisoli TaxID=363837 RepID=A0A2P8GDI6_9BACT|nr:CDC27 family protein [Chitinophaga ginsengisoli]PSL32047.1 Tfp pilus assembly protein PilF [Chitinophaga ginsengisoli]
MNNLNRILCLLFLLCSATRIVAQSTVNRNRVMEYLQDQQYDEAIAYLRPTVDTTDARQVALLAYTYYQAGKIPETVNYYEKVLRLDSSHLTAHQCLAAISLQQDRPLTAMEHYKKVVALRPQSAVAWKQLSFTALAALQQDSGFVWLNKAYTLNPYDPRVVSRLAEEWIERKRFGAADTLINTFLATDSSSAIVLMTGARISYLMKDYQRTLTIGQKLKQLNILSSNTFIYVSAAAFNLKKYDDCIAVHEYLNARNASVENIIYYAAMACTQLKRYQDSNELLQTCITMARSASLENYYTGMSVNYEALGQYKPAIANLDTAYYLFHQPLKQYSIGRIYDAHLKNDAMATRYYKRYIQLYKGETQEEKEIYNYLKTRVQK